MTKAKTSADQKAVNKVFFWLFTAGALAMFLIAGLAYWAHNFTSNMVRTELSAQKIYFPEAGSPALNPEEYPDLQQYAGQLVDTPQKAKAYANGYIGRHLSNIADGKVYSEVSAEAAKDPTNEKLQKQKQSLFQGETLRGILLTSGYGFGTVGNIAGIASVIAAITGVLFILSALYIKTRY